jgi:formylmethanofuran dehydrogenase subunit E
MYKVGKVFMEDVAITLNEAGQRIAICPICEEEILLADDELIGDTILCELCNTLLKLIV